MLASSQAAYQEQRRASARGRRLRCLQRGPPEFHSMSPNVRTARERERERECERESEREREGGEGVAREQRHASSSTPVSGSEQGRAATATSASHCSSCFTHADDGLARSRARREQLTRTCLNFAPLDTIYVDSISRCSMIARFQWLRIATPSTGRSARWSPCRCDKSGRVLISRSSADSSPAARMMQITGCCVLAARSSEERSGVLSLTGDVRAGGGDAWRSPRLVLSSRVAPRIGEELGVGMSFTSHAK